MLLAELTIEFINIETPLALGDDQRADGIAPDVHGGADGVNVEEAGSDPTNALGGQAKGINEDGSDSKASTGGHQHNPQRRRCP